jgi:quinol monooxygenase YgiN
MVGGHLIVISGTIKVKPERLADTIRASSDLAATSRSETGCRDYRLGVDVEDRYRVHLFEEWASEEDLNVHFATPHFAAFSTLLVEVLAEEPTFIRYEAVSSGPLFG